MKVPRYSSSRAFGGYMTPMIDVVFLLIIFFLVSSHLARREQELPVQLPSAVTGDAVQDARPRLTLHVFGDGQLHLGGATVPPQELPRRLGEAQARAGGALDFRIRADRSVAYAHVAWALAAAYDSGLSQVSFSVIPRAAAGPSAAAAQPPGP